MDKGEEEESNEEEIFHYFAYFYRNFFSIAGIKLRSHAITYHTFLIHGLEMRSPKEVIKLVYKKFYASLFGELMVYTPHSGNYIAPGVLQFCQEKY